MFVWDDDLLTGNQVIDEQHKGIFKKLDSVLEMSADRSQPQEIIKIFEFLVHYVYDHFNCEEELMKEHHYNEYELHRQHHMSFTNKIGQLAMELKNHGTTSEFITQLKVIFIELFVEHIDEMDKKFARYLKTV